MTFPVVLATKRFVAVRVSATPGPRMTLLVLPGRVISMCSFPIDQKCSYLRSHGRPRIFEQVWQATRLALGWLVSSTSISSALRFLQLP